MPILRVHTIHKEVYSHIPHFYILFFWRAKRSYRYCKMDKHPSTSVVWCGICVGFIFYVRSGARASHSIRRRMRRRCWRINFCEFHISYIYDVIYRGFCNKPFSIVEWSSRGCLEFNTIHRGTISRAPPWHNARLSRVTQRNMHVWCFPPYIYRKTFEFIVSYTHTHIYATASMPLSRIRKRNNGQISVEMGDGYPSYTKLCCLYAFGFKASFDLRAAKP